jgi:hypothetical protein
MGVGLDAQIGLAEEVTWGTYVAPARWTEFSSETLGLDIERSEFIALKAPGRVIKTGRWVPGKRGAGGDIETAVFNKGQGVFWKHALGTIATSTPTNGVLTRDHTATPGDLLGKGLSVQVGRPFRNATTPQSFSYLGQKVASWRLEATVGEFGKLTLTLLGKDEDTTQALGTYSPPSGLKAMYWANATLTIAAVSVNASSVTIDGNNQLNEDSYALGSNFRREPLEQNIREYTGTIDADFATDLTLYNRFVNGMEATLVLTLQGDQIEAVSPTYFYSTIVTANVRFDGETPKVGGPAEVRQNLPFKVIDTGSLSLSILYRTTDTSP